MNISAKLVGESETKQLLRKFEKYTGKGIEEGIEQIARSSAKGLAGTVQPYGMSEKVGRKFMESIEMQVRQVYIGINLGYYELKGTLEQTYQSLRRNGVVRHRRFRTRADKRWQFKVQEGELNRLVRKQVAKAGKAKAAWISAGNKVGKTKISGVRKWISRHVNTGYASSTHMERGLSHTVELHNQTPYLKSIQDSRGLATGLRRGRANGIRSLKRAIDYQIKKLNQ